MPKRGRVTTAEPKGKPKGRPGRPRPGNWPGLNGQIGGEKGPRWPGIGGGIQNLGQLLMLKLLADLMGGGGSDTKIDYGKGNSYGPQGYYPGTDPRYYSGAPSAAPTSPSGAPATPQTPYITPEQVQNTPYAPQPGNPPDNSGDWTFSPGTGMWVNEKTGKTVEATGAYVAPDKTQVNGTHDIDARDLEKLGVPPDQAELAKRYGEAFGVDPVLLLSIAKHETGFGKLGLGREGLTLGVGAYDSGPTMEWQGPENQYRKGAELLNKWGVHGLQDIQAGKAAQWATDPGWESGIANAYKELVPQLGSGSPLPEPPEEAPKEEPKAK